MRIYLAGPFFNDEELNNIKKAENILEGRGFTVISPRKIEIRDHGETGTVTWARETFENDRKMIDAADAVVMMYYGAYSDSGTAWECGYAFAAHKPVIVVHLGNSSNLMVHEGCHSNITFEMLESYDFERLPVFDYKGEML